ncbi:MAG: hypothetical protein BGO98_02280 [Myxococcales bacterium 68-20]|nr:hypothetical protein [Myxococcales bacterium]OJY21676.1 MAG: hypothetical protein BGO98_02280 [Myxococcales bacterium 68-20]
MNSDPKRLFEEDPGIAHLLAVSKQDGPPAAHMEKLRALATQAAAAPRRSWWTTRPSVALGIAAVGVSVFGIAVGTSAYDASEPAHAVAAPQAPPALDGVVTTSEADEARALLSTNEASSEAPVPMLSIEDLAPAALAAPARSASAEPRARRAESGTREIATATQADAPMPSRGAHGDDAPAAASGTSFDEELALVSAARAGLQRGDVAACMRAVDAHRTRFGAGTFAQEVEVIRIEGLLHAGDRAQARTAAEQFLAAHGASPYADRVRSLHERSGL